MEDYILQNKKAWEYNAYEFWVMEAGAPAQRAKSILAAPEKHLKRYARYFDSYEGLKIANICGSCGKKAVPLAVLGADVTIFDISEDNRCYALELAEAAGVTLDYQLCDVLEIDLNRYEGAFDVVFMEGGILHYFHDIGQFMSILHRILKPGGMLICSDFHPYSKISGILGAKQPDGDYFSQEIFEGEMAHARFFDEETRKKMPLCSYRRYTLSEIVNVILSCGFTVKRFEEHPAWTDSKLPGEFTILAEK